MAGSNGLKQKVPCYKHIEQGQAKPFMFKIEQCLLAIAKSETKLECGYFCDDPTKNHTVSLANIVPDLLLQDTDPDFLLYTENITYHDDDISLLSKETYIWKDTTANTKEEM